MEKDLFKDAWSLSSKVAEVAWEDGVPDIRWRAHVAIWAAHNALRIEGDFVECGVHTGRLSLALCKFLDFGAMNDRTFWLFDTWAGVPLINLTESEQVLEEERNSTVYKSKDVYSAVERAFSGFTNCRLIKGVLPGSLQDVDIKKIAYLSMDLGSAAAEKSCIDVLWPKLTSGAFVVIDYGWAAQKDKNDMWDSFAASQGITILTLPTGQGLLVR